MFFTLLLVALSGANAQLSRADQEPQKCCINHQFSATLHEFGGAVHNGEGSFIQGYQYLNYDYDARLMSIESHRINPATGNDSVTDMLLDYNTNREYMRLPTGACYYRPITDPMREPCIPANAAFVGAADYGFGPSTLSTYTWEFDGRENLRTKLVVTEQNCIPVFEASLGEYRGDDMNIVYLFDNFSPSINDKRLLTASTWAVCDTPLPQTNPAVGKRSVPFS